MTWQERLDSVLRSWQRTPYMAGCCVKGAGVDCRYFMVAVLDELYGITGTPLPPRLDPMTALHDRGAAVRATRAVVTRWPCTVLRGWHDLRDDLEPGDVLVTRRSRQTPLGDPGHCLVAGVRRCELWHTTSTTGVCRTGLGLFVREVVRVYRPLEKDTWSSSITG